MLCNHCGVWVLKSTYYHHQRDYGIADGVMDESDSEKEPEVFAAEAEEQFERNDDGGQCDESKHKFKIV